MWEERVELRDEALVAACRQGDAAAWETLVSRYQRLIYSIPRRAGLDAQQCEDVFQHVFTTLLTHLDRLEQPDRVRAWLVTTARYETWRVSRKARTAISWPTDEEGQERLDLPHDVPLPIEVVEQMEEQHVVRLAMSQLKERCRRLLTLLYYRLDSPSYAEIAAKLGMPEGSVGPTRARCLQKLRDLLIDLDY